MSKVLKQKASGREKVRVDGVGRYDWEEEGGGAGYVASSTGSINVTTETIVEITSFEFGAGVGLPAACPRDAGWRGRAIGSVLIIKDGTGIASDNNSVNIQPPQKQIDVDELEFEATNLTAFTFTNHFTVATHSDIDPDTRLRAPIPACVASGASIGKTLTAVANGVLTLDSHPVLLNEYVLLFGQMDKRDNGVYQCTTEGVADSNVDPDPPNGAKFVLTRTTGAGLAAAVRFPGTLVKSNSDGVVYRLHGGIDGMRSIRIATPYESVELYSNGLDWRRVRPFIQPTSGGLGVPILSGDLSIPAGTIISSPMDLGELSFPEGPVGPDGYTCLISAYTAAGPLGFQVSTNPGVGLFIGSGHLWAVNYAETDVQTRWSVFAVLMLTPQG